MAKTPAQTTDESDVSFFKSLDIFAGSADVVRRHVISCIDRNEAFGIWGKAGIGKTEVVKQVAEELNMDLVIFYLQHKDKEDVAGYPFPDANDPRYVTMRLMKAIPREKSKRNGTLFFWDEFNRADPSVVNACFTMMNQPRMIGDVVLPDDVRIGLAANPSGMNYRVNEVEKDPAILRRANWIGMLPNHAAWVKHATKTNFHPAVISYIRRHKQWLYDTEAHNSGRVCANPASWEKVSDAIKHLEKQSKGELREVEVELRTNIAGLIGMSRMNDFMGELLASDGVSLPEPEEILQADFGPGHPAWEKVEKIAHNRKTGASGKIGELATSVVTHVAAAQPSPAIVAPAIAKLSTLLPGDTVEKFFKGLLDSIREQDTDNKYLNAFTQMLGKQPEYLEVRKTMAQKATAITDKIKSK